MISAVYSERRSTFRCDDRDTIVDLAKVFPGLRIDAIGYGTDDAVAEHDMDRGSMNRPEFAFAQRCGVIEIGGHAGG